MQYAHRLYYDRLLESVTAKENAARRDRAKKKHALRVLR